MADLHSLFNQDCIVFVVGLGKGDGNGVDYSFSRCGLFPSPLGRSCKAGHVSKIRAKFKFLGKFMAKALMDSRMVSGLFGVLGPSEGSRARELDFERMVFLNFSWTFP